MLIDNRHVLPDGKLFAGGIGMVPARDDYFGSALRDRDAVLRALFLSVKIAERE